MYQIFYLTLDPEKALGVEDYIPSYHILFSENSQLTEPIQNYGIDIKQFPFDSNSKIRATAKLLENEQVIKYIKEASHETPNILVFKSDLKIEQNVQKLGYKLLNKEIADLRKLENKVEFARFISERGSFTQPNFIIFEDLKQINYSELQATFGTEFIIQFYFGHSGNSTFFIDSNEKLEGLKFKFPLRKGKVVQKINGPAYTVNACVTRLGTVIGGISEQITGIPALTPSYGGTVGNDFTQRHLNEFLRGDLIKLTMEFGDYLLQMGYKGIFGLDFILNIEENRFYIIETNLRQTASCSFYSYLQRQKEITPILLWHILELVNHNYYEEFVCLDAEADIWIKSNLKKYREAKDKLAINLEQNQPIDASQVFFRNILNHPVKIMDQFHSGVFRERGRMPEKSSELENDDEKYLAVYKMREDGWNTLCLKSRGYNILQADADNGFLLASVPGGSIVPEFGEIGRVQFRGSAFSSTDANDINGWIIDVINCAKENMRILRQP